MDPWRDGRDQPRPRKNPATQRFSTINFYVLWRSLAETDCAGTTNGSDRRIFRDPREAPGFCTASTQSGHSAHLSTPPDRMIVSARDRCAENTRLNNCSILVRISWFLLLRQCSGARVTAIRHRGLVRPSERRGAQVKLHGRQRQVFAQPAADEFLDDAHGPSDTGQFQVIGAFVPDPAPIARRLGRRPLILR